MKYDGSIIINTKLDDSGFKKGLSSLSGIVKAGGAALGASLVAGFGAATKAGIDFESAFAGIRKTVDATEEQFKQLESGILEMSQRIPQSAAALSSIGEAAGQLGIKTENLEPFIETMANLGVATNMTSEQAATDLARLANITQMPQTEFNNLGSTVVALGNNLATTESEIVEMSLRLAGAGNQVGMTEAQILSFSGALSSVGIEAEAGGTAFSKLMSDMQLAVVNGGQSLQNFAAVAGMSASEFQKAFQTDAASAIISFITGLSNASEQGKSAIQVLDEMGITEIRMRDALLRAAGASDVFTSAIQIGTKAWEENVALTNEAEQRYQTMESQLQLFKNGVANLGIAIYGGIEEPLREAVASGTQSIGVLTQSLQSGELSGALANVGTLFGNLVNILIDIATAVLPPLINTLSWLGENLNTILPIVGAVAAGFLTWNVVSTITPIITGLIATFQTASLQLALFTAANGTAALSTAALNGTLTASEVVVGLLTGKITLATAAQTAWNAVMNANPIGIVITAVAALAAGLVIYNSVMNESYNQTKKTLDELDKLSESYENVKKSIDDTKDSELVKLSVVEDTIPRLEELSNKTNRTAEENQELNRIIDGLNQAMPDLKLAINEETGALNQNIETVWRAVDAYRALAKAKAAQSYLEEAEKNKLAAEKIKYESQDTVTETPWWNPLGFGMKSPYEEAEKQIAEYEQDAKYWSGIYDQAMKEVDAFRANSTGTSDDIAHSYSAAGSAVSSSAASAAESASNSAERAAENAAREAEEERQSKVAAYKEWVSERERLDLRAQQMDERYGKLTDEDHASRLADRAKRYRAYAQEVIGLEYMTEEEKIDAIQEYIEEAENVELELYEFQVQLAEDKKQKIVDAYTQIAEQAKKKLSEIQQEQLAMEQKLNNFATLYEKKTTTFKGMGGGLAMQNGAWVQGDDWVISETALANLDEQNRKLEQYFQALQAVKERGVVPDDFFSILRDLSVEEGTEFANALLRQSDDEFSAYLESWKQYRDNNKKRAEMLYEDDVKSVMESTNEQLMETFGDVPEGFWNFGIDAAENFGQAFLSKFEEWKTKIQAAVDQAMTDITPQLSFAGGGAVLGSGTATYNTTYHFASTNEPVSQQIMAAQAAQDRSRARGF